MYDHRYKPLLQTAVSGYRSQHEHGKNGAAGLSAEHMHIANGSLSRKVNPQDQTSHPSPAEIVTICRATGDLGVLHAMAADVGCLLMPLGVAAAADLAPDLAANFKEVADWLQVASAAHAAGPAALTDNKMAELGKEMIEAMASTIAAYQRLQAMHAAAKPTHLRAAA